MSGTTIAYGDRPIANVQGTGAYATFEFLQFLERLSAAQSGSSSGTPALQAQVNSNTAAIGILNSEVSTLNTAAAANAITDTAMRASIISLTNRMPAQSAIGQGAAVALTSGTVAQITSEATFAGGYVLIGTVYLTGTGTVTLAQASAGLTAATIETAPGAFATGWFGAGASPGTLAADLSLGSFTQRMDITAASTAYLNVRATFTGAISAYGNLLVWRVND